MQGLLGSASLMYRAGVGLRNFAYDCGLAGQTRVACPVISVGNLSVGGTGKTVCVEYLAEALKRLNKRVCVLSRGYSGKGRKSYVLERRGDTLLADGRAVTRDERLPDEPQLLAWRLKVPVLVGPRRVKTGRLAVGHFKADAILLDDGFQHRRLARDLEIVLVNGRMPLGGWPLLPRGPMREPLGSLSRANVILITKADQSLDSLAALKERLKSLNPKAAIATAMHEPSSLGDPLRKTELPLDRLSKGRLTLASSIGDPDGFEHTVAQLGGSIVSHLRYPDHYRYALADWEEVLRRASVEAADAVVTTEKDLIRLRPFLGRVDPGRLGIWVLGVRLRLLSGEDALHARLLSLWPR